MKTQKSFSQLVQLFTLANILRCYYIASSYFKIRLSTDQVKASLGLNLIPVGGRTEDPSSTSNINGSVLPWIESVSVKIKKGKGNHNSNIKCTRSNRNLSRSNEISLDLVKYLNKLVEISPNLVEI